MSEHRVSQAQDAEIEAALATRVESNLVDAITTLQQNIDESEFNDRIMKVFATKQTETQQQNNNITTTNGIVQQIRQVLESNRDLAIKLWKQFEDVIDDFDGNVQELWIMFTGLSPWEKILVVLGALAIIFLIGTIGYFSWQFVYYIWSKLVNFAKEYGSQIASAGVNFLSAIQNSESYRNFTEAMESGNDDIDLTGWNSLLSLGMPTMLTLYQRFFEHLFRSTY